MLILVMNNLASGNKKGLSALRPFFISFQISVTDTPLYPPVRVAFQKVCRSGDTSIVIYR